jgi:sugar lactone lactonase YvrE
MNRRISTLGFLAFAVAAAVAVPGADPPGAAVPVLRGVRGLRAVAADAQASVFFATGAGEISQLAARNLTAPLAATRGSADGLAFDATGNMYAADARQKSVWKVTPWGAVSLFSDKCGDTPAQPVRVAVSPAGQVFFTDGLGGRVCRAGADGKATAVASGLASPTGIAVSAASGAVFVAASDGNIWKIAGRKRQPFAKLEGAGTAGGMALDAEGNLYIARDGGGRVSILDASGKPAGDLAIPGPTVSDLAFGGATLQDLYAVEAESGTLYRVRARARARSQRLPWEDDAPLAITEPVDGAILNRHDGTAAEGGLRIAVKGRSRTGGTVRINGAEVPVRGGRFETSLVLKERETAIRAEAGRGRQEIKVLWDRDSFRRYRFSVDDNVWFLRDIARHADSYKSLFDNPYLAFWRDLHRKYGTKVHFNVYYETDGFNLTRMPDKYRDEWRQNADWIRLTFHARANNPDRPYLHTTAERIRDDYRLVSSEIRRFAGPELLSPVTTVHWGTITRAGARALHEEGVRTLAAYFQSRDELPDVCMYLPWAQWTHLSGRDYWKDTREDLLMVRHDMVVNLFPVARIVPFLDRLAEDPHRSEVLELMIHEQYFYPTYVAYEPDYRERVETAVRWAAEHGYKPVFYADGFVGAPAK